MLKAGPAVPLPEPPGQGGDRPGQRPRRKHRGVFLPENDFNTCYDATLICLCGKVLAGGEGGGGGKVEELKNVGLQLCRSCLKRVGIITFKIHFL